jgi:septal ring factor EnvC (AmiA/AmiB activator)
LSNNTTRRLDNTYYSVLEKLAALQSTIASLKELASITRELDDGFKDESREVVKDAELQINSFDKFETQQRKIGGLETRIKRARERIKKLGDRVEEVRDRVETWETLEDDWQQRMRQRLKVVWAIVVVLFLVVVGLLIFPSTPSRTSGVLQGFNATNPSMDVPELEGRLLNETMNFKRRGIGALESLRRPLNDVLEDDPRLLAFDEL